MYFNTTYSAGLLVINSFFCVSEKVLLQHCFWKICSLDIEFKIDNFFFFQCFKGIASLSFHLIVSKTAVCSSVHNVCKFLWLFFWFSFSHFWCHFSFYFHVSCVCGPLSFLVLVTLFFFNQILKIFGHFILKYFLIFPSFSSIIGTPATWVIDCLKLSQSPLRCIFFFVPL